MPTCVTCYSKYEKSEFNQSKECDICYSIPDPVDDFEEKVTVERLTQDTIVVHPEYF